ncbi:MAG TPA: glycerophosphoryl diester phosphodiesterase membrane domain-containing protein [Bryobacteraceae bacterium]|nr:glycerophosphoryl diester phosphodiesterase membrane domain-containing protein [Bryobacteraceae bacterium]
MTGLELRPLSLGEILDRTFFLYRRHFLVFIGISGIPQLIVLALNLTQLFAINALGAGAASVGFNGILLLLVALANLFAYLFAQGGAILAVSDLYLGRPASIGGALRKVASELGPLFGVVALNGLAIGGAMILLIVPGIYVACRLLICVPAALIEGRGPRESLSRSWDLTRDNAGRAFVILLLVIVITLAAELLFALPFTIPLAASARNPGMFRFWTAIMQVGNSVAAALVRPIVLIATSIYYYDLRVRKEAFDIQFMMNPESQRAPNASGLPSII